jgi:hypothetical protein
LNRREFLFAAPAVAATASFDATLNRRNFLAAAQTTDPVPNRCAPQRPDYTKEWKFPVALWLDPIDDHRTQIEDLILHFSNNYGLPSFRPHCTLVSGYIPDLGQALYDLLNAVDRFCSEQGRVSLKCHPSMPVDWRDDSWSTFLYLTLDADSEAKELFAHAEKIFAPAENEPSAHKRSKPAIWLTAKRDPHSKDKCPPLMPHVSLAYAKGPREDIDRAHVDTTAFPSICTFGSLRVVMPAADGDNPGDWENIVRPAISADLKKWNIIYSRLLLGRKLSGLRSAPLHTVISGGQEGTDQTALHAARKIPGLTIGGYCPPGRETNRDTKRPPIPNYLPLEETPERDTTNAIGIGEGAPGRSRHKYVPRSQRTEWNCRESDGVLMIQAASLYDPGTIWTLRLAKDYNKPICFVDPFAIDQVGEIKRVLEFLRDNNVRVLNVAGPARLKNSEAASEFFEELFTKATSPA